MHVWLIYLLIPIHINIQCSSKTFGQANYYLEGSLFWQSFETVLYVNPKTERERAWQYVLSSGQRGLKVAWDNAYWKVGWGNGFYEQCIHDLNVCLIILGWRSWTLNKLFSCL